MDVQNNSYTDACLPQHSESTVGPLSSATFLPMFMQFSE